MHSFTKGRRARTIAVAVLLGWLFSFAVSGAYGCTLWKAAHQHIAAISSHDAVHDIPHQSLPGDASRTDADVCEAACDLQSSPVVNGQSDNVPDQHFMAPCTSVHVLALSSPSHDADNLRNKALPSSFPHSLRTTRLTL